MTIDLENLTTPPALLSNDEFDALGAHGGPYEKLTSYGWVRVDPETVHRQFPLVVRVKPAPLTKPSIDWSQLSQNWRFLARDENGSGWIFTHRPAPEEDFWNTYEGDCQRIDKILVSWNPGTCKWLDSLVERPEGV